MASKLVAALVAAVLAVGCGSATSGASGGPDEGDASARLACDHFRNVAGDVDVLTTAELRDKVAEIHDTARVSEVPGIAPNARAMLSAITQGDSAALDTSVRAFGDACRGINR